MNSIRRLAVSVLLENNINSLPIDVKNLRVNGKNVMFTNYDKSSSLIEGTLIEQIINENSALTVSRDGKYCVLLNPALGATQRLEKIAHELGHIACEHEGTDGFCGVTNDCAQRIIQEAEAEYFKTELLAPTIVLCKMGAGSTEKIQAITGVSQETAEKALVEVLHRSSFKNPFLTEDEKLLWDNFKKTTPEQEIIQETADDNFKHSKRNKILFTLLTISIFVFVVLDCKFNIIPESGNYIEPQYREYTPLTPDNEDDDFFEPKTTQNNITPTKNNTNDNYTVFVTASGKKYHKATCHYLTDSQKAIKLYDAISEGYEPCSICKP